MKNTYEEEYRPITVNLPLFHHEHVGKGYTFCICETSMTRSINGGYPKRVFYYTILDGKNNKLSSGWRTSWLSTVSKIRNKTKRLAGLK